MTEDELLMTRNIFLSTDYERLRRRLILFKMDSVSRGGGGIDMLDRADMMIYVKGDVVSRSEGR